MLFWLLAGLGVYLLNVYLTAFLFVPATGILSLAGSRDALPPPNAMVGRARRGLTNLQENMPFFITLGLLAMIVDGADMQRATLGAQIFVIARLAYIPLYLISIPFTRSAAYLAGLVGNVLMLVALL